MPGKRVRKDSERSTGSAGTLANGNDLLHGASAGSSSSGSVEDADENTQMRTCCFPAGCPFGEDLLSEENSMVKLICNYDGCTASQFMHTECFNHWEESILNCLRSYGRARSWSEKQRRQNLWTKKGYDLAYRACVCKCKHGHLRKDLDWIPQAASTSSEADVSSGNKKKNRKKHKDLPSLGGYNGVVNKTRSKPIPSSKDSRIRHSSTSSVVSVDQGYISASPGTSEMGPSVFSPPSLHHRSFFHNSQMQPPRSSNGFHVPSTSPLPEIPDDVQLSSSPDLTPSPNSPNVSSISPPVVFSPAHPFECEDRKQIVDHASTSNINGSEVQRFFPSVPESPRGSQSDVEGITTLIDNLWQRSKPEMSTTPTSHLQQQAFTDQPRHDFLENNRTQAMQIEQAFARLRNDHRQLNYSDSYGVSSPPFSHVPFNSPSSISGNRMEQYYRDGRIGNSYSSNNMLSQLHDINCQEQRNLNSNAQLVLALRQKEQNEMEKRELNNIMMNMISTRESNSQIFPVPSDKSRHNSHTEIRLVPMRSTTFAKRYDFCLFENVLARQHINPYHIKMEGEGYGSDDLRNFILASLSKAKCSQMNCVVCGVDLPVYDHFPLVDGTMFLSPEKNERSTTNCFKIKVETKCEYVHAACMRCMEGLHNIICRMCNTRWEGVHHQLGTLYMFDIFAATPCCQQRLCCKQCGGVVVDIRQGLTYFSEYSTQKTCPHCHSLDYHFVHPTTSFQLMGVVYS